MWLKSIAALFAGGPYYVRISAERIAARDVRTGNSVECKAVLGLDARDEIVSVGEPVSPGAVRTVRPFDHPRIVVDDYVAAERVLQHVIRRLSGSRWLAASPVVLIHPDVELAGGLTPIEVRALRELAEGAGARKAGVHYGRSLTDQEVLDFD